MTKLFSAFAFLAFALFPSLAAALTGTYEDLGSFEVIRLSNGELVDVTNRIQQAGDNVYATVLIDGVTYTVYDRGPTVGPIYAVPD